MSRNEFVKIVIVGHVDHGKSTLIGRLFYDTGSLPQEKYEKIKALSLKQGRPVEFAYVMDALEEEQEQNITIDTAHSFFYTGRRNYVIIDAPGHKEFLKNMITGAASADAAILLVDAVDGVREQTRRHAYVLSLLGIRQVIVFINKLDLVAFSRDRYETVQREAVAFLASVGLRAAQVIPGGARDGINIAERSSSIDWYTGSSLLEALDSLAAGGLSAELPLRFAVQDVYKTGDLRVYAGRIESGALHRGQEVIIQPGGKRSRIKTLLSGVESVEVARHGDGVGVAFEDELFIERGAVVSAVNHPVRLAHEFTASVFWLGKQPLQRGVHYQLKIATASVKAQAVEISERIDSSTLEVVEKNADRIERPETASVVFRAEPFAADLFSDNPSLGRFVIVDEGVVSGGGIIRSLASAEIAQGKERASFEQRLQRLEGRELDLTDVEGELVLAFSDEVRRLVRQKEFSITVSSLDHVQQLLHLADRLSLGFSLARDRSVYRVAFHAAGETLEALGAER